MLSAFPFTFSITFDLTCLGPFFMWHQWSGIVCNTLLPPFFITPRVFREILGAYTIIPFQMIGQRKLVGVITLKIRIGKLCYNLDINTRLIRMKKIFSWLENIYWSQMAKNALKFSIMVGDNFEIY